VATHEDLSVYKPEVLSRMAADSKDSGFFELNIRGEPYRFMLQPLTWGGNEFVMGLGASKTAAKAILHNVNYAFFTVAGAIIVLLIVLSLIISKILMKPLYDVLNALEKSDFQNTRVQLPATQNTELGLLTDSFNEMSGRIFEAQSALKSKIAELEKANLEIRDTQARLVHTAKMASLGQLVAGIAHELNNPIGFIYSNMSHLRDYAEKLMDLVKTAEKSGVDLSAMKEKIDFDYVQKDLPRLIQSCEDGARRTRDIVVGLRNFSRLEEAQIKEVDIHESLDTTLQLLTGELKNRIKVVKKYSSLPPITCYPSQLNQVFMNILSNAAQAIEGEGEIRIETKKSGKNRILISIHDSGVGMSKSTVEKIFDPFFTTKGLGQGTGLGLSISYGIIQNHGGEIRVESEPGKGTEFIIELPIKLPA
jgi:two-component system NtrC family sensor kinase